MGNETSSSASGLNANRYSKVKPNHEFDSIDSCSVSKPSSLPSIHSNSFLMPSVNSATLRKMPYYGEWSMYYFRGDCPIARIGHFHVFDNTSNEIIIGFGSDYRGSTLNDIWKVNVVTKKWTLLMENCVKKSRSNATAIKIAEKVFIFGGTSKKKKKYFNDLLVFNIQEKSISRIENCPVSPRMDAILLKCNDSKLVICGGEDKNGAKTDLFIYDLFTKGWTEVSKKGQYTPRKSATFCQLGDDPTPQRAQTFIFGGTNNETLVTFDSMKLAFTEAKSTGAAPPSFLTHVGMTAVGSEFLFVIGGEHESLHTLIYCLDLNAMNWFTFYVMPDNETTMPSDGGINNAGHFIIPRVYSNSLVYSKRTRSLVSVLGWPMLVGTPIQQIYIGDAMSFLHLRDDLIDVLKLFEIKE